MEVTATNLNVRSTPSTSGKILGKLSKGTRISVMKSVMVGVNSSMVLQ